jgi:hypothetical protein
MIGAQSLKNLPLAKYRNIIFHDFVRGDSKKPYSEKLNHLTPGKFSKYHSSKK